MRDDTWHMSEDQQFITLCIAVVVCVVIALGIWIIARDVVANDSLEEVEDELDEITEDLYLDRDQHAHVDMKHWKDKPRKRGCLNQLRRRVSH